MGKNLIKASTEVTLATEKESLNLQENSLFDNIEKVVDMAEDSRLSDKFFEEAAPYIKAVDKVLDLTDVQTVLFSLFVNSATNGIIELESLSEYTKCKNIRLLRYMSDVDVLMNRKLVHRRNGNCYYVPMEVLNSLKENHNYVPTSRTGLTTDLLFAELEDLYNNQINSNEITIEQLATEIRTLLADNPQLHFSKVMNEYVGINDEDLCVMLCFFHLYVNNEDNHIRAQDLRVMYSDRRRWLCLTGDLERGNHFLQREGIVEYCCNDGLIDTSAYRVSDAAKKHFFVELKNLNLGSAMRDLKMHENLVKKEMFYNDREAAQIAQLTNLLKPERFKLVQNKLVENGMRKGFACLFHGDPGTGKTETVYQIAKSTGRNIVEVNYAKMKSCWVGESEKHVKALFDRYRECVRNSEIAPILLFNEADALLSSRMEKAERAVDKMENSIQNIILQEMENLEGIMIATTNLTSNLDDAFERRFIYKIEFSKPGQEAKRSIWKSLIPMLKDEEADELAQNYDFSGGQIENIARKRAVDSILSDKEITIEQMKEYCNTENIVKKTSRFHVGY